MLGHLKLSRNTPALQFNIATLKLDPGYNITQNNCGDAFKRAINQTKPFVNTKGMLTPRPEE